jgi:DNA-binding SARP family transcriptional activator
VGARTIELSLGSTRLLAFLALSGRPLMRNFVAFSLWPDKEEDRAFGNLRSALWRIRQTGLNLVESSGQRMQIGRDVIVDLHIVTDLARRLVDGERTTEPRKVTALLSEGDLLPDYYDAWVSPARERLRQQRVHALEALSRQLLEQGDAAAAIEAGLAAVAVEPLRESAHRAVIQAHLCEGNLAEALRQYEAYRYVATTELGILPSDRMEALVKPLRGTRTSGQR